MLIGPTGEGRKASGISRGKRSAIRLSWSLEAWESFLGRPFIGLENVVVEVDDLSGAIE